MSYRRRDVQWIFGTLALTAGICYTTDMSVRTILFFCCLAFSVLAKQPEYALKLWTVEDRLPGSPVLDVAQSRSGYLWMVTQKQLIRFNGADFRSFPLPFEVMSPFVPFRGVFCDSRDGVWVFGEQGIARFHAGTWQNFPSIRAEGVAEKILGMEETQDHLLYAYAERGLFIGRFTSPSSSVREEIHFSVKRCPVPSDDRATLGAVTGAALDAEGRVWMTAWNGLVEYESGRFDDQSTQLPDFLVEAVSGVCAGKSGRLWVHGPNGVAYRENDIWTPIGFPKNAGMATVMTEVSDGALWIGNPTGLFRWQDGKWLRVASQDVPGSLSINALIEDADGTLWAGCDGGLLRIRKKIVQALINESSAAGSSAYSLCHLPDGGAWVGYKERAVHLKENGGLLQTIYLGIDVPVSAILQDSAGQVWIGTLGAGLFLYRDAALSFVPSGDYSQPQVHTIYTLYEDQQMGLLAGTPQGIMRVTTAKELEPADLYGTAVSGPVRAIRKDGKDGTFLVCGDTFGVLQIRTNGSKIQIGEEAGLRGFPRCLYRDSRGNVWAGTTLGLFSLRDDAVIPVDLLAGLSGSAVLQISEDERQRLWLGTTEGLQCISIEGLERRIFHTNETPETMPRMLHLGISDGLPGERCLGGLPSVQGKTPGKIWFPTEGGIAVAHPDEAFFSERIPSVVFESVSTAGIEHPLSTGSAKILRLPPGARNLRFAFSALAPGIPETIRYRYRLDETRKGWSPIQNDPSVSFEWLPPGRHTLRVAAEAGGIWNETGAVFTFEIGAFFWQTIPFYLAMSLLLAVVAILFARWILWHRYQFQMAALKREEALSEERARISRDIHDDLGNGLSVVATLSELAQNDVEKESAHKRLDQIYEIANGLARNVDEIVWAVNPANDGWEAFVSYFEQYTEYFLGSSGLRFRIVRPDTLVGKNIAAKARHHLLLAVREAVGNVLKHAEARQVKIIMSVPAPGNLLEVRVEDDGKGFSPERKPLVGHDGLGNMARRMKMAGGELAVKSVPGHGTSITFRVPLEVTTGR